MMLPKSGRRSVGMYETVPEAGESPSALISQESGLDKPMQRYETRELVQRQDTLSADGLLFPFTFPPEHSTHPLNLTPSPNPPFLSWPPLDGATLPPRLNPKRSRLSSILSPLNSIRAGLPGDVTVEGLGGIIESAHNLFHSAQRLDFMESERMIHLPPRAPPASDLPRRELERYENELFDISKYAAGGGGCEYLTVLAWTEEGISGSITLYEVLFGEEDGEVVGIRPVAAMRDVPTPVLVKMRTNERVKRKLVFAPVDEEGYFRPRWRANPSSGPRYVRLGGIGGAKSPLRSASRSRSRHPTSRLADAEGVSATIPQFVALLHARRAIVEEVESSYVAPLRTEDGEVKPAVALFDAPRSNPHDGDGVHVAVLIPEYAPWAEEEIIWTDSGGLVEFRQARYWDLIETARDRRSRSRSIRREESRGRHLQSCHRSGSRMRSPSQRHGRSRSGG